MEIRNKRSPKKNKNSCIGMAESVIFCELCIEKKKREKTEKPEVMHKKDEIPSFFFCYFALIYIVGI